VGIFSLPSTKEIGFTHQLLPQAKNVVENVKGNGKEFNEFNRIITINVKLITFVNKFDAIDHFHAFANSLK
jgi:hypothetical protein